MSFPNFPDNNSFSNIRIPEPVKVTQPTPPLQNVNDFLPTGISAPGTFNPYAPLTNTRIFTPNYMPPFNYFPSFPTLSREPHTFVPMQQNFVFNNYYQPAPISSQTPLVDSNITNSKPITPPNEEISCAPKEKKQKRVHKHYEWTSLHQIKLDELFHANSNVTVKEVKCHFPHAEATLRRKIKNLREESGVNRAVNNKMSVAHLINECDNNPFPTKQWTEQEKEQLTDLFLYGIKINRISVLFNASEESVKNTLILLHNEGKIDLYKKKKWTEDEILILKNVTFGMKVEDLFILLNKKHTPGAIKKKLSELGIRLVINSTIKPVNSNLNI